ncbi:PucR family transcriptional regulator [Arthrobacter echini]|uniref:PucR family transcriptional regulator n=1 Tax=Arthrobacter echini TaxID=1529066 RepID=A0A5D0XTS8_9MICC|nr:helix-turn-helix domain-containing protein [Arthrobacter echini]TYC99578.1 PucR family transcriptional regulator [Arthrobacter echini]
MISALGPRIVRSNVVAAEPDSTRWNTLLDGLRVEALTDEFLSRVLRLPHYRDAQLPAAEIRRTGEQSFEALIRSLRSTHPSGAPADSEELRSIKLDIATDVGVSRARADIPVDALMTAIRLDFSVLWDALMALSGPDDAPLLVARADTVWQVVDAYASQTQGAYIAERQRMTTEASSVRQGLVASLFGVSAASATVVERAATALGLGADQRLSVAVAAGENAGALRVSIALAARRGAEVFTHPFADALLAFWPTDAQPGAALHDLGERSAALRCGLVDDVVGLTGLHDAGELALELARLATEADDTALRLQTDWARLARSRLGADGIRLAADVDAALAGCGQVERERLVETARAYVATGSIAASAESLFCHRNTLMNRMRRFSALTGIDLAVPVQAARLVVAWA